VQQESEISALLETERIHPVKRGVAWLLLRLSQTFKLIARLLEASEQH